MRHSKNVITERNHRKEELIGDIIKVNDRILAVKTLDASMALTRLRDLLQQELRAINASL